MSSLPFESAGLIVTAYDKAAQEDSLRVTFKTGEENFEIASSYPVDLSREANGAMELVFDAVRLEGDAGVGVGMRCDADDCERFLPVTLEDDWAEVRVSLSCFADIGADMAIIKGALLIDADAGQSLGLSNVRLEEDQDASANCG